MTDTIHKFPLTSDVTLAPAGKVLLVAYQGGTWPTIWIQRDPTDKRMIRYHIEPTGGMPLPSWEHVGSCICGPHYVWRVYRAAE